MLDYSPVAREAVLLDSARHELAELVVPSDISALYYAETCSDSCGSACLRCCGWRNWLWPWRSPPNNIKAVADDSSDRCEQPCFMLEIWSSYGDRHRITNTSVDCLLDLRLTRAQPFDDNDTDLLERSCTVRGLRHPLPPWCSPRGGGGGGGGGGKKNAAGRGGGGGVGGGGGGGGGGEEEEDKPCFAATLAARRRSDPGRTPNPVLRRPRRSCLFVCLRRKRT